MAINLGFFVPSLHYGGGEIWTYNMIRFLDRSIVDYSICIVYGEKYSANLLGKISKLLPVYVSGYIYFLNKRRNCAIEEAISILKNKSDIVIIWGLQESQLNIFNGYDRPIINMVVSKHVKNFFPKGRYNYYATCSEVCVNCFPEDIRDRVKVIPNGIDLNRCFPIKKRNYMRNLWEIEDKVLVLGYLGRLDPIKNCEAIARVVAAFNGHLQAVCYVQKDINSDTIKTNMLRISPTNIKFYDAVDDIGSILNAIDVIMLPSYSEVFPLVVLEAWAAKVPVVATNVGELHILYKEYGELFIPILPDDSGENLAISVNKSISNIAGIEKAHSITLKKYNVNKMAYLWLCFLEDIIEETN